MRTALCAMTLGLAGALGACSAPGPGPDSRPEHGPHGPAMAQPSGDRCEGLARGPGRPSPHGPMSNADFNRDGSVTQAEVARFMSDGPYRQITLLAYFDRFDQDRDAVLSEAEFARVDPPWAFNGVDANADCVVSRVEVEAYVDQPGRSYRKVGLTAFFDLIDTDHDGTATASEIEAAHRSGLLARD